jgi:hypothetical protein
MAENLLQAALNLTPGQQNPTATALAFEANISAQPHHQPIIAATGMWLAQPDAIMQRERDKLHHLILYVPG